MYERIICLTEETAETLYLLGEDKRIAGISAYTVRPQRARTEKPIICAFTDAKIDRILELQPDLVLGFSDLQSEIAAELIRNGVEVHVFNQRSIGGILKMIRTLGSMIGQLEKSADLTTSLEQNLLAIRQRASTFSKCPRVYFEEWHDPLISGIGWVSELIECAGGEDCFGDLAKESLAKDRIIADPSEVVTRAPDIIIGSWCGKPFDPQQVKSRRGWTDIPAVRNDRVFEIESSLILQPGPAALTDGVGAIANLIGDWVKAQS